MTRSFGLVDYEVQEAEYFLLEMQRFKSQTRLAAVQFCAPTFVSAARSIWKQAGGCLIETRFSRWLGKDLPRPPRLPPFAGPDDAS